MRDAIERYAGERAAASAAATQRRMAAASAAGRLAWPIGQTASAAGRFEWPTRATTAGAPVAETSDAPGAWPGAEGDAGWGGGAGRLDGDAYALTFGAYGSQDTAQSQPAATSAAGVAAAPTDYWKADAFSQAGSELVRFTTRNFWRGYRTAFWDLENALALAGTMGASIAIRETGVDDTIRRRIRGHRQLGELDETIQIIGNPATHFAGAGVLWLASTLTRDVREHEVARKLTEALAVNGVTTLILKASANTRAPDGERHAWPSGHTSSAFTAAAVVNEYYGPWAGIPSLALAGLVGYQRLDSRTHDFSDVVVGAVLGYVIGSSIARDGKAEFPEIFGMTLVPFTDERTGTAGLALMKQF